MTIELPSSGSDRYLQIEGGESLLFHCHHYNAVLQQSVEDAGSMIDVQTILRDGAAIAVFNQLGGTTADSAARLAWGVEFFHQRGFGQLKLDQLTRDGGTAVLPRSHYAEGFKARAGYGERTTPTCHFAAGFVEGLAAAAFDLPLGSFGAKETQCAALGADQCVIEVTKLDTPRNLPKPVGAGTLVDELPTISRTDAPSNIDEPKILAALSQLPLTGNEDGLIPAFGVYLTQHYGSYYGYTSFEVLRAIEANHPSLAPAAEQLLVEAGHTCAFNTFGGIMSSPEWEGLILPMIKEHSDWVYGIVACINALGWGRASVSQLLGNERLVLRADGSYESNYYLGAYGAGDRSRCYLMRGGAAGIMNLLYVGDITKKPQLTADYYQTLFSGPESFAAVETKCRAKGDEYCEFVAERARFS